MGMRRLSIIDLGGGKQPITNEDGRYWIVFNGEIYNYRALREGLLARGHRFPTTQRHRGARAPVSRSAAPALVEALSGMFGFAIWDRERQRAARSRATASASSRCTTRRRRAASSSARELKSLLCHPDVRRTRLARGALALPVVRHHARAISRSSTACASCRPATSCAIAAASWRCAATGICRRRRGAGRRARSRRRGALAPAQRRRVAPHRRRAGRRLPLGRRRLGERRRHHGGARRRAPRPSASASKRPTSTSSTTRASSPRSSAPTTTSWSCAPTPGRSPRSWSGSSTSRSPTSAPSPPSSSRSSPREHVKVVLSGDGGDEVFAGYDRYGWTLREERRFGWLPASAALAR